MHNRLFFQEPRLQSEMQLEDLINAIESLVTKNKKKAVIAASIPFTIMLILFLGVIIRNFLTGHTNEQTIHALNDKIVQTRHQMWDQFDHEVNPATGKTCHELYPLNSHPPCWMLISQVNDVFCQAQITAHCEDINIMQTEISELKKHNHHDFTWLFILGIFTITGLLLLLGVKYNLLEQPTIQKILTPSEQNILNNIIQNNNLPELNLTKPISEILSELKQLNAGRRNLLP